MSAVERLSRKCFVPGCTTGYNSDRKRKRVGGEVCTSLFKTPKDPVMLQKWHRAIPRDDKILGPKDVVCALHFPEENIVRFYETKLPDGTTNRIERGRPMLMDGAVPCIFPNLPSYLSKNKKQRKPPAERIGTDTKKRKSTQMSSDPTTTHVDESVNAEIGGISTLFEQLKNNLNILCTPNEYWSGTFIRGKNEIVFSEWDNTYVTTKKIVICEDMSFKVLFRRTKINCDNIVQDGSTVISSFLELENVLKVIDRMEMCTGTEMKSTESCTGIVPLRTLGQRGRIVKKCSSCKLKLVRNRKVIKSFMLKRHRKLQEVVHCVNRKHFRLKRKVTKLINEVEEQKKKCAAVTSETLNEVLSRLPRKQQEAVQMCFAAAKMTNSKSRRYTLAWIYECLLIRIKGRAVYEHLRQENLLPLPCINTLNKYIIKMNGCYGFQKKTFELLKKKASCMKPEERRGTLLIDEMKLTETLTFDNKTLEMYGLSLSSID